jgi:uncharacterized integral membrane protein
MRNLVTAVFLVPIAVIFVIFAVANREIVAISFDPFSRTQPAFALQLPLFVMIFALLGLGVLIGGIAAWFRQHKWRARARSAEAEVQDLRARLAENGLRDDTRPRQAAPPLIAPPVA